MGFALLMMLAFVVEQGQQRCGPLLQAVWAKLGSKRRLWEQRRARFADYALESMRHLFEALFYGLQKATPILASNSSYTLLGPREDHQCVRRHRIVWGSRRLDRNGCLLSISMLRCS